MINIQNCLLKIQGWYDYDNIYYLRKACEFAIVYDQPKVLKKLLKNLPIIFGEKDKLKCQLSKLAFVLKRNNCQIIMKKCNFPVRSTVPASICVKQLIKLLDISHIREEVIESLTNVFVKSTILTRLARKTLGHVLNTQGALFTIIFISVWRMRLWGFYTVNM